MPGMSLHRILSEGWATMSAFPSSAPALLAALASLLAPTAEAEPCWDGMWMGRQGRREVELIASGNEVIGFFADGLFRPVRARTPDTEPAEAALPLLALEPLAFGWGRGRGAGLGRLPGWPEGEAVLHWEGDGTARLTLRERGLDPLVVTLVRR